MSNFITKADYYVGTRQETIDQLTDDDDELLDKVEKWAEKIIRNHLFSHYDVAALLAATDDDRDEMVLEWGVNLALYKIYKRTDDDFVPDSVVKDFDDTMEELEKISHGRKQVDLPRLTGDDELPKTKFRHGGAEPRSAF